MSTLQAFLLLLAMITFARAALKVQVALAVCITVVFVAWWCTAPLERFTEALRADCMDARPAAKPPRGTKFEPTCVDGQKRLISCP